MKLAKLGDGPEIFHTIQGEGASVGCPAVFIRASLCNLHCIWCDTDHTWNFIGTPWPHQKDADPGYQKFDKSKVIIDTPPAEAARMVLEQLIPERCSRVVITGGEPLLQQDDFVTMIDLIRNQMPEVVFEVETNGTQIPSAAMAQRIDQFNISPKLANSGMAEEVRLQPQALEALAALDNSWFKFVVAAEQDLQEIQTLRERYKIPPSRVILMPEGRTTETLNERARWLAERCKHEGLRFGDRLHVRLWGDRRGV